VPRALIIGCHGQDGQILSQFLFEAGYEVAGVGRTSVSGTLLTKLPAVDISRAEEVSQLVRAAVPDEIYYLAAYHHSSEDVPLQGAELLRTSFAVNTLGLVNVLGAMLAHAPSSRLFYAGSSHMFGDPAQSVQDETTPFNPLDPYGISKCAGIHVCRHYRAEQGLYASAGILYNHESSLRSPSFISRKIVQAAVRISKGLQDKVTIGDPDAMTDWGYAPDYVEAMWKILQLGAADDFVIATGVLHSVGELVQTAFDILRLDWRQFVVVDPALIRKRRRQSLCGNIDKIRNLTGWQPRTSFRRMLEQMIEHELA
jgi:GDPmannose 4,6-dehydratase